MEKSVGNVFFLLFLVITSIQGDVLVRLLKNCVGTGPMQTALRESALQDWAPSSVMGGFNIPMKKTFVVADHHPMMQNEQYATCQ